MSKYYFQTHELIYAVRKTMGITQQEYCKILNLSQSAVSKIEKGILKDIHFDTIVKISKHFDIPLNHFVEGHLPILPSKLYMKNDVQNYLKHGIFSSKTIFLLKKSLECDIKNFEQKEVILPFNQITLAISSLRFNKELLKYLVDHYGSYILSAIDTIEVPETLLGSPEEFKLYIQGLSFIEEDQEQSFKQNNFQQYRFKEDVNVDKDNVLPFLKLLEKEIQLNVYSEAKLKKYSGKAKDSFAFDLNYNVA